MLLFNKQIDTDTAFWLIPTIKSSGWPMAYADRGISFSRFGSHTSKYAARTSLVTGFLKTTSWPLCLQFSLAGEDCLCSNFV